MQFNNGKSVESPKHGIVQIFNVVLPLLGPLPLPLHLLVGGVICRQFVAAERTRVCLK